MLVAVTLVCHDHIMLEIPILQYQTTLKTIVLG